MESWVIAKNRQFVEGQQMREKLRDFSSAAAVWSQPVGCLQDTKQTICALKCVRRPASLNPSTSTDYSHELHSGTTGNSGKLRAAARHICFPAAPAARERRNASTAAPPRLHCFAIKSGWWAALPLKRTGRCCMGQKSWSELGWFHANAEGEFVWRRRQQVRCSVRWKFSSDGWEFKPR